MSLEGQQLGRYHLQHLLGSGGMGEVYLAMDTYINRQVAIKVIRAEASSYPDATARKEAARLFQREMRTIAVLDHPYILPLYDYGEEQTGRITLTYIVMPYRKEGSLADWLHQRKSSELLTPGDVGYLVHQAASALQHAHNRQIIHQDIKPSNFLIRSSEEQPNRPDVLLADFGVAKFISASASLSQAIRGTPAYMSPEQWEGVPVPATDQYALAVMAYELLTGRPPFQGGLGQMMYQHFHAPPQPPSTLNPCFPKALDTVLLQALAKKPAERFASITVFDQAFQQAVLNIDPHVAAEPMPAQSQDLSDRFAVQSMPGTSPGQLPAQPNASGPTNQPRQPAVPASQPKQPAEQPEPGSPPVVKEPESAKRGRVISRRSVLVGLAALATASGGVTWLVFYLRSREGTLLYTYQGHTGAVNAVAWSPNGKRIASASFDDTVQVWNAADGSNAYTYQGHTGTVNAIAWSPNGKRIASASDDDTVQVWNAADGSNAYTYQGHTGSVHAVAWSPDGSRIASAGSNNTVQVWNAADGSNAYTYHGHTGVVLALSWSPNGSRIASASNDGTVRVWNAADGSNTYTYRGHIGAMNAVAWSPNGSRIASASNDGTVQVWNAADGSNTYTYRGHAGAVNAVAWSPNGSRIASASSDGTVQVWNAADGSNAYTYHRHTGVVDTVSWSPNGKRIASAGSDGTVQVWLGP